MLLQLEHYLAFPFFGIRMKTNLFQSCDHCWVFQICWHIECNTLTESFRKRASSLCIKTHSVYTHSSMSDSGELIQNPLRTHPSRSPLFLSPGLKNSHEYFSPFYLQFSPRLVKCRNFSFVCLVLYISWAFVLGHFFLTELFHTSASNISNVRLINRKLTFSSIYTYPLYTEWVSW